MKKDTETMSDQSASNGHAGGSTRVLLVDDHKMIREALRLLLEKQPDIEVIADTDDGRKAFGLVKELSPDVVIVDVTMPGLNGFEATRLITAECPTVKVVALSVHSQKKFVAGMLSAGATGYVLKECLFDGLLQAIQAVTEGKKYLSSKITDVILDDDFERVLSTADAESATLTSRERQILQLVSEGKSTKRIAFELHLSTKTVEANRRQIMEKLNIRSIAELTKYAIREGLTTL